jgi:SAM-dependent methyltransferase
MPDIDAVVNFNQRGRDAWVAQVAASLPAGARVLDVGAGQCRYQPLLAHCEYHTHDFCQYEGAAAGAFREAWNYGRIEYVSDITAIPVPDESFDAVLCTEVLEHVPEPIAAINEIGRLLRVGGRLFLSAPLGSGLHQQPHHYYGGYTPHFYRRFLPECGMEIVRMTPNGGFYRHLAQELARAAWLIPRHERYSRWNPAGWLVRRVLGRWLPLWLSRLDERHMVEEFTVGFHVEARKTRNVAVQPGSAGLRQAG